MKKQLSKRVQIIISAIISLLGFSGCAASSKATDTDAPKLEEEVIERPEDEIRVMYGSPTLSYQDGRLNEK
ncbi:MAG: hypothetical protein J6Q31_04345 [Alistipes sp.]|nr:hypothetical protein [Alistipes sp.]